MSIYTPENAYGTPAYYTMANGDQFMAGLFFLETAPDVNNGWVPALCRLEGGMWSAKVTTDTIWENRDTHYPTGEARTDADVIKYNDWLREEYGDDGDLSELEEFLRDATQRLHEYDIQGIQLVLK